MADRYESGVLDTCVYLDLHRLDPADLPEYPQITAVTMAELHQGVAMARNATTRAARLEQLDAAVTEFEPLPFDRHTAARYGTLVSLVVDAGRNPRPRWLDLLIAATASELGLPLYTRNVDDFAGLERVVTIVGVE